MGLLFVRRETAVDRRPPGSDPPAAGPRKQRAAQRELGAAISLRASAFVKGRSVSNPGQQGGGAVGARADSGGRTSPAPPSRGHRAVLDGVAGGDRHVRGECGSVKGIGRLPPAPVACDDAYPQHRPASAVRWPATDALFLSLRGTRLQDTVRRRPFRPLVPRRGSRPEQGRVGSGLHLLVHPDRPRIPPTGEGGVRGPAYGAPMRTLAPALEADCLTASKPDAGRARGRWRPTAMPGDGYCAWLPRPRARRLVPSTCPI